MRKPEVLLLSGWSFMPRVWSSLYDQLSRAFDVKALDYPDFSHTQMLSDQARAELISREINQSALVIGWSLGGSFALDLAFFYPEKVGALITLGSNPCFVQKPDWPGMDSDLFSNFQQSVREDRAQALRRFRGLVARGDSDYRAQMRSLETMQYPADPVLIGLLDALKTDRRMLLKGLSVPRLWVGGRSDALVPITLEPKLRAYGWDTIELEAGHVLTDRVLQEPRVSAWINRFWGAK